MDSETVLDRDAVRVVLLPLADRKVMATTGAVLALNHETNLLTRLPDLRYGNSFRLEWAAYLQLGSALCCYGARSADRQPGVEVVVGINLEGGADSAEGQGRNRRRRREQ